MPHRTESGQTTPIRVLFVCLGNICRSPLAEYIVRQRAIERGFSGRFHLESAGTGDWHIGKGADRRMQQTAAAHDIDLAPHRASQITRSRIGQWDWFIAMDATNRSDLLSMGANPDRTLMMRQFEHEGRTADVPDPYYGGEEGFEEVFQLLRDNADALIDHLNRIHQ
ncbi:MAG: protein tyrosine phosphatase [Zetaproteobacteria bacterium CG06_land_8_20_14_3_00_59_53]|nr:MAG: protein tyrosine phosphatase [Zetaproteobacteria bacterium CG2_30_59_37]PIO90337.1 MAG: protein tyrosine phosphatase [Zetaproteobacteria bacterium CG23_combo_of_CG06-09_8_20_14_all_59_86]PIQ65097.1 MAG: protein tyrosine phosphatase [Zetaproteobacteria bacterium CG11_big_fil_rev_8_21_14_0_20_59_439]PIU70151.1 MAG: protein tyrosine phosphatase [Zetaproteobacteria bacterium CG06_land_8_20_14_3_00_59_53]PIU96122.1 MAG: protein tyrosine phosphatase [Zetaproteobacteria bacterium CG03_land_8_2